MDRYVVSDAQWAKMEPHCLGKKSDPGRSGTDNRRFVEAVLRIARTGSPRRDLPAQFGPWNTVFKRYRDWVKADVFKRLFDAVSDQPDMEYAMIDATNVKAQSTRRPYRSSNHDQAGHACPAQNFVPLAAGSESPTKSGHPKAAARR
jgi:transposase